MLCTFCQDVFNRYFECLIRRDRLEHESDNPLIKQEAENFPASTVEFPHHTSRAELLKSVNSHCEICVNLWRAAEKLDQRIYWAEVAPISSAANRLFKNKFAKTERGLYFIFRMSDDRGSADNRPVIALLAFNYRSRNKRSDLVHSSSYRLTSTSLHEEPFKKDMILETLSSTSTGSDEVFNLINHWLKDCDASHGRCKPDYNPYNPPSLPTRLIYIGDLLRTTDSQGRSTRVICVGDTVRIMDSQGLPYSTRYAVLSHCWGTIPFVTLTKDSLRQFYAEISLETLSPSFRDAIDCTRRLHLQYLWIDSLCIIQDDPEDWQYQSMLMRDVYSNSYCTIAVTGFADGQSGMYSPRKSIDDPLSFEIKSPQGLIRCFSYTNYLQWVHDVEEAPLHKRGWVTQERVLSPKIVHFSRKQVLWECRAKQASELSPRGLPLYAHIKSIDKRLDLDWINIVQTYTKGALTRESDKLIAISGLTRTVHAQRHSRDLYLAGLCSFRPRTYLAPSWSWAAVTGQITWERLRNEHDNDLMPTPPTQTGPQPVRTLPLHTIMINDAYTSPRTADELGAVRGYLKAKGPLRLGTIQVTTPETTTEIRKVNISRQEHKFRIWPDAYSSLVHNKVDLSLPQISAS